MRKSFVYYLSAFSFIALLFSACTPDDPINTPNTIAPKLPTAEMFIMPFDDFEDTDTTKSFNNWFYAASNVVIWNTVIALNTIIPVAAFFESFNHDGLFIGNNTWEWTYSYSVGNDTYNARLAANLPNDTDIKWNMYIAKQGGFSEALWYEGTTKIDESAANWTLNRNGSSPEAYIGIDFIRSNNDTNTQIEYTNLVPDSDDNGDKITYIESTNEVFDAIYMIYRIQQNNTMNIQWSKINKDGRIKDPTHYGNEDWYCWNEDLQDMNCL